jgi:hypothetical protein
MYKLISVDGKVNMVQRLTDFAYIPFDPANVDYQQYLKWIADGNVAQPAENN